MNINLLYFVFFICLGVNYVKGGIASECFYEEDGWYKYHEIPMTWNDAVLYCQLNGAILASPTTTKIKNIMSENIKHDNIFTGINSVLTKGEFYSLDGIPLSSMPLTWYGLEPDNKYDEERCIAINVKGYIFDVSCHEPRPFMCFRRQEYNICGTQALGYHHDNRTEKCYKFHTIPQDFLYAYFNCSTEGGHLAIINSGEESKVISEIYANYPADKIVGDGWKNHVFMGFYFDNKIWITIQGQSLQQAGFAKFAPGEPSSPGVENCGSVDRNGLLNDLNCFVKHAFICEKSLNLPKICDNSKSKYF